MHNGTTRVLVVARGTKTIAHCIGLQADKKMKMEEWDMLLKHQQPESNFRLIDDHNQNCARGWPPQTSRESKRRSRLCCGIDYRPTECENTTTTPGVCFTVYCDTCWEEEQTDGKARSFRGEYEHPSMTSKSLHQQRRQKRV